MGRRYLFLHLDQRELALVQQFMNRMANRSKWRERLRGSAILESHHKKRVKEIARDLGRTEKWVYQTLQHYRQRGIEGITPQKYPTKLTHEQITELLTVSHRTVGAPLKDYHRRWSLQKMTQWVKDKWGITVSREGLRRMVKRHYGI